MPKGVYIRKPGRKQKTRKDAWSKADIKFIRDNYKKMFLKDIAAKLGRTLSAAQTTVRKHGLTKIAAPRPWTEKEINFLKENYDKLPYKTIGGIINRCHGSMGGKLKQLGLKLPENVLKERQEECLKYGHGWNKGLKGIHFSPESEFKKGHTPANTLYDGAIRIRRKETKDGKVEFTKWIRIEKAKWVYYTRWLWMQH